MKNEIDNFLFSDNIWLEGDKGWFAAWNMEALFEWNLKTNTCRLLKEFPDFQLYEKNRKYTKCMKYKNSIFCFPCNGECIWVYDLQTHDMERIEIDNPLGKNVIMFEFWCYKDIIYTVAKGLKQIIEIDGNKKKILNYHTIGNEEEILGGCVKVGDKIYIASTVQSNIYEYDLETNKERKYHVLGLSSGINRICFDGKDFWLSGRDRKIYLWNKENQITQILSDLPNDFGEYDFENIHENIINCNDSKLNDWIFYEIINTNKCIWCIPFRTNRIIYVNKETKEINSLRIQEEEEDRESLASHLFKYLVEYYKDNRFIGLYSLKNRKILEIDTETLSWKYKDIKLQVKSLGELLNKSSELSRVLAENVDNKGFFELLLLNGEQRKSINITKVGFDIYDKIKE